jgi:IclR family transcriptional regulator, pca regulon regulatory protein
VRNAHDVVQSRTYPSIEAGRRQLSPKPAARYFVKSLDRTLAVIRAFDAQHPAMSLSDAARRAGITRAAARRILLSLTDLGYAEHAGALFRLSPRILELGFAYLASNAIAARAQRALEALTAVIDEPCSMSVLDDGDIVYVARSMVSRLVTVSVGVGTRLPAYATAMGRVLLAGLEPAALDAYFRRAKLKRFTPKTVVEPARLRRILAETRQRGFAYVRDELEIGMEAVAVPVIDAEGRTIAAISAYTARVSQETALRSFVPKLKDTARVIGRGA